MINSINEISSDDLQSDYAIIAFLNNAFIKLTRKYNELGFNEIENIRSVIRNELQERKAPLDPEEEIESCDMSNDNNKMSSSELSWCIRYHKREIHELKYNLGKRKWDATVRSNKEKKRIQKEIATNEKAIEQLTKEKKEND